MHWRIILVAALAIIIACIRLVKNIMRPVDDEDLEYYSKWR
jgi:hypothetical protein